MFEKTTGFEPQEMPEEIIRNADSGTISAMEVPTVAYLSVDDR